MKTSSIKYRKLPKLIRPQGQGFDYHLIERKGDIAWYEARYPNGSETKGWVVAKIKRRGEEKLPDGYTLPPREVFPKRSKFGSTGWYYMPKSKSLAEKHYLELTDLKKG